MRFQPTNDQKCANPYHLNPYFVYLREREREGDQENRQSGSTGYSIS